MSFTIIHASDESPAMFERAAALRQSFSSDAAILSGHSEAQRMKNHRLTLDSKSGD